MIEDTEILKILMPATGQGLVRPRSGYSMRVVSVIDAVVHAELTRGLDTALVRLNLPSTRLPMPWLYMEPEDAADWVDQLFVFLDEEVDTRGLDDSRVREMVHGKSYVVVTGYGFKVTDEERDAELSKLAGPHGDWSGAF